MRREKDILEFASRNPELKQLPRSIRFSFVSPSDLHDVIQADPEAVVFANDLDFSDAELIKISSDFSVRSIAQSWHGRFLLNPEVKPFDQQSCRSLFSRTFREHFAKRKLINHQLEVGIFTQMTAGYQPVASFDSTSSSIDECRGHFRGQELLWARRGGRQQDFVEVIAQTCDALGMRCQEVKFNGRSVAQLFGEGVGLISGSTGFWPLDPLGDLQMLFTPNMHQHLRFVTDDPVLQNEIRAARSSSADDQLSHLHAINKILFDKAIYNIYTHHQYFYVTGKEFDKSLREAPIGVTVPYPWQLFGHE